MKKSALIILAIFLLCFYSGCKTAEPPAVYFETNSVIMVDQYQSLLDNTGQRMKTNPALQITLLAYSAPAMTAEWQILREDGTPAISEARAKYITEYLESNYGVTETRIRTEYKDIKEAGKKDNTKDMYRRIEIIIDGDKK